MKRWAGLAALGLLAACGDGGQGPSATASPSPSTSAAPVAVAPSALPSGPLAPTDTCSEAPGAAAFLSALRKAVAARDAKALSVLADPDVRLDFGGGAGREELARRLSGSDGAGLWAELDEIVALGCALDGDRLVLPALFAQDLGTLDPYTTMVVTGSGVPLFAEARVSAPQLATLSWQAVALAGSLEPDAPFQRVVVPGGPTGFVQTARLRSVLDYRLIANRAKGEGWRLTAFVAGD